VAQRVELIGGDIRPYVRRNEIEHFRSEAAGDAHFVDFFLGLDDDGHDWMGGFARQ
jgi:hypothetical protein